MKIETDIVIIGSGIAALQAARVLSKRFTIHLITKSDIRNSSSYKAQGGIAAVISQEDHISLHIQDTLHAGEYHHVEAHVEQLVKVGKDAVQQLINQDFPVDRTVQGDISLGLEGAHSKPRILHSGGDATGKVLIEHLIKELPQNVEVHEHEIAYELLLNTSGECIGVKTKNDSGDSLYYASYVILATGGAGSVYACTSNCPDSVGDGIALAYLAGAQITDMEFVQFHPSLLYINGTAKGLVSEAVRGAGGYFADENGNRLMEGKHPLGDLAPRHVTAFEMYKERAKGNEVYLDISGIADFERKFPTITQICEENGVSISQGRIPIAPGSHFLMGGVVADQYGRTSIPRLLAVGEVACTGVHGANRLASNSLLEGITFGKLMAEKLLLNGTKQWNYQEPPSLTSDKRLTLLAKETLQNEMLDKAGVIRSLKDLTKLQKLLPTYNQVKFFDFSGCTKQQIELAFMHITASLIVNAALSREESRGAHIRTDFPSKCQNWQNKWVVFEKGKMNVRDGLYEQNQTANDVKAIFQ
ncbi:L-aspartate oxidase [Ureibacillus chungkukjangi]|uniref:L-aspartate oxidase n=1 Tax=Ureibacillus chungkukjangi TaxID=1202712 RepID=UPI00203EFA64|nr:L-aspartate oxidase [Ureibacillus chungkukjangi]MCM3387526.1 L-aspartate oxidase [Ureibacillus chungkukjangi]